MNTILIVGLGLAAGVACVVALFLANRKPPAEDDSEPGPEAPASNSGDHEGAGGGDDSGGD
jgi:hypothetical protein